MPNEAYSGEPALAITEISAVHGRGARARQVLAPTSLEVRAGESVAVVGRSGAGKSTLADVVLGLRAPASGSVEVSGERWCSRTEHPRRARRRLVQGVPQDPVASFVPGWTLRRTIARAVHLLTGDRRPDGRIARAAELAHLDPALLDRVPREVSGGQAQRAAIARALAVDPAVLVADEPTSALDPRTAAGVSSALLDAAADTGIALLLVTHDPLFAERCTRTVRLTAPDASEIPERTLEQSVA